LLHDARNLMGTLGLYCDLLSMPDVLKPEHRQYADDLRLVGKRSGALIEDLIEHLTQSRASTSAGSAGPIARAHEIRAEDHALHPLRPVSLRRIVERCSGLLSRVACGRAIDVTYGEAAAVPVAVAEETVERILVNLVRNSAASLRGGSLRKVVDDSSSGGNPGAIRIGVGLLENRVGEARPWPFQWVKLTVEDSGCGMSSEQIERLLGDCRTLSTGGHGIGFRVVRDLVGASNGDLRVMSAPGMGTRVQIEWPVTGASSADGQAGLTDFAAGAGRRVSC